jgi:hypothetical protein
VLTRKCTHTRGWLVQNYNFASTDQGYANTELSLLTAAQRASKRAHFLSQPHKRDGVSHSFVYIRTGNSLEARIQLQTHALSEYLLASMPNRVVIVPIFIKAMCVYALKGLALPRASHSGEIAHVACVPHLRQRQSFSRKLSSQ